MVMKRMISTYPVQEQARLSREQQIQQNIDYLKACKVRDLLTRVTFYSRHGYEESVLFLIINNYSGKIIDINGDVKFSEDPLVTVLRVQVTYKLLAPSAPMTIKLYNPPPSLMPYVKSVLEESLSVPFI